MIREGTMNLDSPGERLLSGWCVWSGCDRGTSPTCPTAPSMDRTLLELLAESVGRVDQFFHSTTENPGAKEAEADAGSTGSR